MIRYDKKTKALTRPRNKAGGARIWVIKPSGLILCAQGHNVLCNTGVQFAIEKGLKDVGIFERWYMGFFTAGSVATNSLASTFGGTEFTDYVGNDGANERMRLDLTVVDDGVANDRVYINFTEYNTNPIEINSSASLIGLFITNQDGDGAGLSPELMWAGVVLDTPIAVEATDMVTADYYSYIGFA